MSHLPNNSHAQPDNKGSAYPSPARQLARRWQNRRSSPGVKGLVGALIRRLHCWYTEVQVDQRRPDIRFVFMLSAMRSGSSMLSQVLCSHPSIVGFGETHIRYSRDEDFIELIRRNMWADHRWRVRQVRYFEKILHAELIPDIELLSDMPIDWIVLRRSGEPCVQSMMRTFGMSAEHASAYFQRQWFVIDQWVDCLLDKPENTVIELSYESLLDQTDSTLATVSTQLGLTPELGSQFSVQKGTERDGAGDPSGNLSKGRIERIKHDQVELSGEIKAQLAERDLLNEKIALKIRANHE